MCSSISTTEQKNIEDIFALEKDITQKKKLVDHTLKNADKYRSMVMDCVEWYEKSYLQTQTQSQSQPKKHKGGIRERFNTFYGKLIRKYRIQTKKSILIYYYRQMLQEEVIENHPTLWSLLQKRPSRNISGVAVITVLTSPYPNKQRFSCKHNCYYCPNEPGQPRSYLKKEPAVARANRNEFDALKQMNDRLQGLIMNGHEVDKLEIIIEGGTYTEYPREYLETFHRDLIYAANTFYDKEKRAPYSVERETMINASAKARIIGICIETRPDTLLNTQTDLKEHEKEETWLHFFRRVGVTRVQLGVQHTNNDILKKVNRGHTYEDAYQAMVYLKNNCFKVDIHLMPDLPGSTPSLDKDMFDKVFDISQEYSLQPDQAKIYPCEVTPWTIIQQWHKKGIYKPYAQTHEREFLDVIKYGMMKCPPWVRLPRVIRDIPLSYIEGGNMYPNLRQMLTHELEKEGHTTMDIRARECGRNLDYREEDAVLKVRKYEANEGLDIFISMESEDEKCIFGFLRLRLQKSRSSNHIIFPELERCALIREVHVYGALVPVGKDSKHTQHKGFGRKMLQKAFDIASQYKYPKIAVISGMGVVDYYKKFGFMEMGSFLIKQLDEPAHQRTRALSIHKDFTETHNLKIELSAIPSETSTPPITHPYIHQVKRSPFLNFFGLIRRSYSPEDGDVRVRVHDIRSSDSNSSISSQSSTLSRMNQAYQRVEQQPDFELYIFLIYCGIIFLAGMFFVTQMYYTNVLYK